MHGGRLAHEETTIVERNSSLTLVVVVAVAFLGGVAARWNKSRRSTLRVQRRRK
jgi:hypothetical protein